MALVVVTLACGSCVDRPGGHGASDSSSETSTTAVDTGETTPGTGTDASSGSSSGTGAPPIDPEGRILFTDVTAVAGLVHDHGPFNSAPDCLVDATMKMQPGAYCSPEWAAAGVAVADVDGDGWVDLYVTRLTEPDLLYRNNGDGTFTDIAAEAGLDVTAQTNGAAWADIDNDGDLDLYVTTIGEYRYHLFINDGDGRFVDEAVARGASLESELQHTGTTPTFGDIDNDGDLDLYVGEWRNHSTLGDAMSHSRLLRNRGPEQPGHFEDITIEAGVSVEDVWSITEVPGAVRGVFVFSPAFADMDGDGFADLLLASDYGTSRLFWNNGDGTFTDGTAAAGVATEENGMGSSLADIDHDGDLDWFVSSISGAAEKTRNRLYRNDGDRVFTDVTSAYGVRDGYWGWGAALFDPNNDGALDLALTNGWFAGLFLIDPTLLFINHGAGPLAEGAVGAGIESSEMGRGLVSFDYDRDGDLDLYVANFATTGTLYRNDSENGNGWLRVRALGTTSNRDSLGARVTVTSTPDGPGALQEIGGPSFYLGHSERVAHFGLGPGDAPVAEVRVRWPASGAEVVLTDVVRDQVIDVVEPSP